MSAPFACLIAFLSGFSALAYEILWYRAFGVVAQGVAPVFGLVLGAYLAGLATGGLVCAALVEGIDGRQAARLRSRRALLLITPVAQLAAYLVLPVTARAVAVSWTWGLVAVAVGAALLGIVFPLLSGAAVPPDERVGARLSFLYGANIAGSAAGSLFVGFVATNLVGIAGLALLLAVWGVGLSVLILGGGRARLVMLGLSAAVLLFHATAFDRFWERLLRKRDFGRKPALAHVIENRHGVIAVDTEGTLFGGGAYDGHLSVSLRDDRNNLWRATALAGLRDGARRVLMIGLGGGAWTRVVSQLPGVASLTIVELNPGYREIVRLNPDTSALLDDPRIQLVFEDARRWLVRHPDQRFDLIVSNTTFHWRAHTSQLLSREFLDLVRGHLPPGGLFFFNTTDSPDVQKTAVTTFPHALRIANFVAASDTPLAIDRERWRRFLIETRFGAGPPLDPNHPGDAAVIERLLRLTERMEGRDSLVARTAEARVVTDDNMACEWND
jgi:spermidine synthase